VQLRVTAGEVDAVTGREGIARDRRERLHRRSLAQAFDRRWIHEPEGVVAGDRNATGAVAVGRLDRCRWLQRTRRLPRDIDEPLSPESLRGRVERVVGHGRLVAHV